MNTAMQSVHIRRAARMPQRLRESRRAAFIVATCLAVMLVYESSTAAQSSRGGPDHRKLMVWIDEGGAEHQVHSPADWQRRRAALLEGMQQAMGPLPDRANLPPPTMQVVEVKERDGYVRQTVRIKAEPDSDEIPAFLYLPDGLAAGRKLAAVLALHQTHPLGKGDVDIDGGRTNRMYASELAQRGYIVLAPDYPSFGDLKDYDFAADPHVSGTMKGIVNHMRCVDLLSEMPAVDGERIGVIGHSLGGHNAMFLAAFDERLKVIVSSCGWTPFHDYYGGKIAGWTSDRYMPRLRDVYGLDPDRVPFDFYEVVGALAPRAFFSNSPLHDSNFDVAGVRKVEAEARKVFELLGAGDRLRIVYPDCAHDFPPDVRREAYQFIDQILRHTPTRELP